MALLYIIVASFDFNRDSLKINLSCYSFQLAVWHLPTEWRKFEILKWEFHTTTTFIHYFSHDSNQRALFRLRFNWNQRKETKKTIHLRIIIRYIIYNKTTRVVTRDTFKGHNVKYPTLLSVFVSSHIMSHHYCFLPLFILHHQWYV